MPRYGRRFAEGTQRSFARAIEDEPHTVAARLRDLLAGANGPEWQDDARRILQDDRPGKGARLIALVGVTAWSLDRRVAREVYDRASSAAQWGVKNAIRPIVEAAWREVKAGGVSRRPPTHVRGRFVQSEAFVGGGHVPGRHARSAPSRWGSPPGMVAVAPGVFVKKL